MATVVTQMVFSGLGETELRQAGTTYVYLATWIWRAGTTTLGGQWLNKALRCALKEAGMVVGHLLPVSAHWASNWAPDREKKMQRALSAHGCVLLALSKTSLFSATLMIGG